VVINLVRSDRFLGHDAEASLVLLNSTGVQFREPLRQGRCRNRSSVLELELPSHQAVIVKLEAKPDGLFVPEPPDALHRSILSSSRSTTSANTRSTLAASLVNRFTVPR
jgi:hypothetical protein